MIGIVGLLIILIFVLLSAESYKTITKKNGNEIVEVEIKKVFGRKISECSFNVDRFYHGPSKSWYIFTGILRSEGNYKNGYWHGRWKDYDKGGQLVMLREWDMGELKKVFIPAGENFKELLKDEWPKYIDVKQTTPQQTH